MSSQRQKKRNAQFRKKHYDSKAQKQPSSKPKVETDVKTEEKATPTQVKDQPAAAVATSSYEPKNYSRRKVVSNWDRYTEGGDGEESEACLVEREEALQQRLVQLLNLPTKSFDEEATFEEHPVTDGNVPSFLSLDCNALALSLSTLPLHKRLDISLELLELADGEDGSEWNTIDIPSSDLRLKSPHFDFNLPDTAKQKVSQHAKPAAQDHTDELLDVLLAADNQLQRTDSVNSKNESVDKQSDLPADTAGLDDLLEELLA